MSLAPRSPAPLPDLGIGDRVRSSARPEWGPGRLANAPHGGKVCVVFREAGPRTLFADAWQLPNHIYAAIRWPWKLVVLLGPTPAVRGLYDLAADPAEDHSLADQHPELVAALTAEIEDYRARVEKARGAGSNAEVDAATREMLRRLGYVE